MKKFLFPSLLIVGIAVLINCSPSVKSSGSNSPDGIINVKEVERIEMMLASNEMRGRKTFSPEIDKAADFIAAEFKAAGLQTFNNAPGFRQEFSTINAKSTRTSLIAGGETIDPKNIVVLTAQPQLKVNSQSGYEKVFIPAGKSFQSEVQKLLGSSRNLIVIVDTSYSKNFPRLTGLKRGFFKTAFSTVFILSAKDISDYTIESEHEITEQKLSNVVGMLRGKSKPDEYVVFSGHYDHLGVGKAVNGDSIYNGANDDAAGITAVIMLAREFSAARQNERTIIFAAFTAEEIGGFGSQYFSKQLEPQKVMAMFNIEMIGTESKWGKNSAYITGFDKTNMGEILAKDLQGTAFNFYADPYPKEQLFYRSDNATLARLGVPAHTISTSKMDSEPNYHKVSDEVSTLDLVNMTAVIKAIALSSKSIIAGTATPSRVNTSELR